MKRNLNSGLLIVLALALVALPSCSESAHKSGSPAPMSPDEFVAHLASLPPGRQQHAYAFKWPGELQYIERLPATAPAKQKLLEIMYQSRSSAATRPGPGSRPRAVGRN